MLLPMHVENCTRQLMQIKVALGTEVKVPHRPRPLYLDAGSQKKFIVCVPAGFSHVYVRDTHV